ncbi:hypothetical protein CBS101457_005677 [Exobasidium rhododendri]|nr:hypothetical protein CBS101457_005677 [Exobasidium rhododendri]
MSAPIPTSAAQMHEIRAKPLARGRPRSSSLSRGGGVSAPTFKKLLAANMRNCRLPNPSMIARCAMTDGDNFHAAHVLPHSFWSTARLHEWLYYAGVIPNGGVDTQKLVKFKYTEVNILWLGTVFATWMEPTKGQLIIVPELHQLIQQAEEILTEINNTNATFRNFTATGLLNKWDESVPVENEEGSVKVYPYSTWFAMSDASLASWSFADHRDIFLTRDARVHHTAIAGEEDKIPMPYSPSLPTDWQWCLSPIITSAVAWKAIGSCCPEDRMTPEAKHQLELIDYYLRLCECKTPSSWRSLDRPSSLGDLPEWEPGSAADNDTRQRVYGIREWTAPVETSPSKVTSHKSSSTDSHQHGKKRRAEASGPIGSSSRQRLGDDNVIIEGREAQNDADEARNDADKRERQQEQQKDHESDDDAQPSLVDVTFDDDDAANTTGETKQTSLSSGSRLSAKSGEALPSIEEERKKEEEEEATRKLEERYNEIQEWRRRSDGSLDDLEPLLVKAEEKYVAKARKIIRVAFEKQAEDKDFSAAMYWLRSNDRIDSIDDRVDRLRARWMAKAIKITDEYESIPQGLDRDGLQRWQRDVSEANSGSE